MKSQEIHVQFNYDTVCIKKQLSACEDFDR